ncbi:MAG: colicin import membrane protein [Pseudoalteromonas tetraodonis]
MRWFSFSASAFILSCILHLLMAGGFTLSGFVFDSDDPQPIVGGGVEEENVIPIDATIIDSQQIEAEMAAIIKADKQKKETETKRVAELEDKAKAAIEQREAEEAKIAKMREENRAEQERLEEENRVAMAGIAAKRAEQRRELLRQKKESEKLALEKKVQENRIKALEQQRVADEKKTADTVARSKAQEQKRAAATAKREADEKASAIAEAAEKLKQAKAAEVKRLEAKRAADEKESARVAEEKRVADEKASLALVAKREAELKAQRKAEVADRRRAQDEERRRQELMAALAREESSENARDLDIYRAVIGQKVNRNWTKPSGAQAVQCVVRVKQIPGGDVVDVQTVPGKCGGSPQYQNSVIKAVEKSSPLPEPSNPDVFDRVLEFTFNPDV